ncbi:hypothetical protein K2173_004231 [Erythroxylum novogranatense]|uniref:Pectinesterase inhibitor domain-containing protein n=1 Tax=Erythroxylum novogranatense TaxID=1862640 RepID=A0AAV8UAT0_9ROSI|nr:hypothetical protein K2173_004231 [Erythroxylum novogranatense]
MQAVSIFSVLFFLSCLPDATFSVSDNGETYVREACSVTSYQDLCVHSLSSFSHTAKRNPSKWARAGVSVTLGAVKSTSQYLYKLQTHKVMKGRDKLALSDCVELFQDAIDDLHKSLGVLRNLDPSKFADQIEDVNTWLSAVLTGQDTCLDGIQSRRSRRLKMLRSRVLRATYFSSNALALVNKLASTGLKRVSSP